MAVLLQYNRHDTLSLNEIQAATAISNNTLSQVLGRLVKAKILINEKKDQYDLNSSTFVLSRHAVIYPITDRA